MDTFRTNKSISKQNHDEVIGLTRLASIIFVMLFSSTSIDMAFAQPSKATHPMVKSKSGDVTGVDKITPKEADDKDTQKSSGWNGSYVGVNAGTSFGATVGTNLVIPLGSDKK
jgi:hypothetical protein